MLKLLGFNDIKTDYFSDYQDLPFVKRMMKGHVDLILPELFGKNMMRIEAIKS